MISHGRVAPWEGKTEYGSWKRVDHTPESLLFDWEGRTAQVAGHWQWVPPPPSIGRSGIETLNDIIKGIYLPEIKKSLDSPFLSILEKEMAAERIHAEHAKRAGARSLRRKLKELLK